MATAPVPGPTEEQLGSPDDEKYPMWVWIIGAVAIAVVVGGAVFVVFGAISGHDWWPWNNPPATRPDLYEVARSATAGTAIIGAAVAGAITIRRQRSTERSVRISERVQQVADKTQQVAAEAQKIAAEAQKISALTFQRETEKFDADVVSRLRDRYTTAAGQLGHDSPAVRLAGTYALATLADEWLARTGPTAPAEAQTCVDLLCAYMRTPRRPGTDHAAEIAAEREVRQSVIRIITAHLQPGSRSSWGALDLDFTGAVLDGNFTFAGAQFTGGNISFRGAEFPDGYVDFEGAEFTGSFVSFEGAEFTGSSVFLSGVKLTSGYVTFKGAKFGGGTVSFDAAQLTDGRVNFEEAKFTDGTVSFDWAQFTTGYFLFDAAEFIGSTVTFDATGFRGGCVTFSGAKFTGGSVNFSEADFIGGHVSFDELSEIRAGVLTGPWPPDHLPSIWPIYDAAKASPV